MRNPKLEGLSDLFKIAQLIRSKAKIKCSDSQRTCKRGSAIFIHSLIPSMNIYWISMYLLGSFNKRLGFYARATHHEDFVSEMILFPVCLLLWAKLSPQLIFLKDRNKKIQKLLRWLESLGIKIEKDKSWTIMVEILSLRDCKRCPLFSLILPHLRCWSIKWSKFIYIKFYCKLRNT